MRLGSLLEELSLGILISSLIVGCTTLGIEDQRIRDEVIVCGGIDSSVKANVKSQYEELRFNKGEASLNAGMKAGTYAINLMPESARLAAYGQFTDCVSKVRGITPTLGGVDLNQLDLGAKGSAPPYCDLASSRLPMAVPRWKREGLINLALLPGAKAHASSAIPGHPGRHTEEYLNDGWYSNCHGWIPDITIDAIPRAEIDLGDTYLVERIDFVSEPPEHLGDRAITEFAIKVSLTGQDNNWEEVYRYDGDKPPFRGTKAFRFFPKSVRYIRMEILGWVHGAPRIDELEVYGRR